MWIAAGASGFDSLSLLGVTVAYQADSSSFVSMLSYLNIVYAYIADQVIFHESLNAIELISTIVILGTSLGVAFYKLRLEKL